MRTTPRLLTILALGLFGMSHAAHGAEPKAPSDYVTSSEVAAAVKKMDPARPAVNVLLKSIDEGSYSIAVVVVRRTPEPRVEDEGQSHERITEVYQIVSGSGTMETGGSQPTTTTVDLKPAVGPTNRGAIVGGSVHAVGPGDTVLVLPHVPHRFSHLDSTIVYIALRIEAKGR